MPDACRVHLTSIAIYGYAMRFRDDRWYQVGMGASTVIEYAPGRLRDVKYVYVLELCAHAERGRIPLGLSAILGFTTSLLL